MHKLVLFVCAALLASAVPAAAQSIIRSPEVVYVHPCIDGEPAQRCGLWIAESDGSTRRLTSSAQDRVPSWSPDGRLIAFVREGVGLHTIRPDGTDLRLVSAGVQSGGDPPVHWRPAWSPDSRRIAFTGDHRVLTAAPDGSDVREVARGVRAPSWSPDGRRIAVMSSVAALLAIYDEAGNQLGTSPGPQSGSPEEQWASAGTPSWSPDGARLLFSAQRLGSHVRYRLFSAPSAGGLPEPIGEGLSNGHSFPLPHAWQSDPFAVWRTFNDFIAREISEIALLQFGPSGVVDNGRVGSDGDEWQERDPMWLEGNVGSTALVYARFTQDRSQIVLGHGGEQRVLAEVAFPNVAQAFGAHQYDVAPRVLRHAGPERIATSTRVSRASFQEADTVIVAPSDRYAEALLAAPLSGLHGAPVHLVNPQGLIDDNVRELHRLGASRVIVVDPAGGFHPAFADELRRHGVTEVDFLAGDDVFSAAAAVADALPGEHAYLVEGVTADPARGWPDAVSVSALAAHQQTPVLYTLRDILPQATLEALRERERVTIVGGTAAVSGKVEQELIDMGLEVQRLSGEDRYRTSIAVADASLEAGLSGDRPWVITGLNYPDALSAGPAAAKAGAALIMVHGEDLVHSPFSAQWLNDRRPIGAVLVGGFAAVGRYAAHQVAQQLR